MPLLNKRVGPILPSFVVEERNTPVPDSSGDELCAEEALASATALANRRRRKVTAAVMLMVASAVLAVYGLSSSESPLSATVTHSIDPGSMSQLDDTDMPCVPKECKEYFEAPLNPGWTTGCDWVQTNWCPSEELPEGSSPWVAKNDASVGYQCCCVAKLWRLSAAKVTLEDGASVCSNLHLFR